MCRLLVGADFFQGAFFFFVGIPDNRLRPIKGMHDTDLFAFYCRPSVRLSAEWDGLVRGEPLSFAGGVSSETLPNVGGTSLARGSLGEGGNVAI